MFFCGRLGVVLTALGGQVGQICAGIMHNAPAPQPETGGDFAPSGELRRGARFIRAPRLHSSRAIMKVTPPPHVVVIGAGFGGLAAARALGRSEATVTLIDRENYHLFQPLLYQVATAGLEPDEIAYAVRGVFQKNKRVRFRMGTVAAVDLDARTVMLEPVAEAGHPDVVSYDALVIAAGARTAYFGTPGAEEFSFGLKRLGDAVRLRSHVMRQFETADRDPSSIERGALTFVVVGGGPTGVEMAGALSELFRLVLKHDFPDLDVSRARVILVEAGDAVLSSYGGDLPASARRALERRDVEVRTGTQVVRAEPGAVHLKDGTVIATDTLIWGAGVRAETLADQVAEAHGLEQLRGGRLAVTESLRVPGYPEAFVIGDLAGSRDAQGNVYPQVAPVAEQQAKHAARELTRARFGHEPEPFRYVDKGSMATIGRNAAVAELPGGIRFKGFAAWVAWLFLHLILLVGFRNRLNVFINWVWNYFTYDRSARLITEPKRTEIPPTSTPLHSPTRP